MNERGCCWHWPNWHHTRKSTLDCCYLLEIWGEWFKWVDKSSSKSFCFHLFTLTAWKSIWCIYLSSLCTILCSHWFIFVGFSLHSILSFWLFWKIVRGYFPHSTIKYKGLLGFYPQKFCKLIWVPEENHWKIEDESIESEYIRRIKRTL